MAVHRLRAHARVVVLSRFLSRLLSAVHLSEGFWSTVMQRRYQKTEAPHLEASLRRLRAPVAPSDAGHVGARRCALRTGPHYGVPVFPHDRYCVIDLHDGRWHD